MTKQETIERVKHLFVNCDIDRCEDMANEYYSECAYCEQAVSMAVNALEKVAIYDQIKWERDIALQTLEEHGISLGEKFTNSKWYVNNVKKIIPEKLHEFLVESGFFIKPSSINHHLAYEGGLIEHSINVAKTLCDLTRDNNLTWERKESPILIGFLHDVCKTDDYMITDEEFKYNPDKKPGHGSKSVEMLEGLIDLTEEEKLCIRYHMGAFTDKSEWGKYSKSVGECPNVLWTHQADMIASQILER